MKRLRTFMVVVLILSILIATVTAPKRFRMRKEKKHSSNSNRGRDDNDNEWKIHCIIGCSIAIILWIVVCICCPGYRNKNEKKDEDYIAPPTMDAWIKSDETSKEEVMDQPGNTVFCNGDYVGRYLRNGIMHDFPAFELNFKPQTSRLCGSGVEEIGQYDIFGKYNSLNNRMAMTQLFASKTGDGMHHSAIRLEWNANTQEFEGKWYYKTQKYAGVNKFWMKPIGAHQEIDVLTSTVEDKDAIDGESDVSPYYGQIIRSFSSFETNQS